MSCWRGSFEWRQIGFFPWTFVSISSSSFERFFKVFFFSAECYACLFIYYLRSCFLHLFLFTVLFLVTAFFEVVTNLGFCNLPNSFNVRLPIEWSWGFLSYYQLSYELGPACNWFSLMASTAPLHNFTSVVIECIKRHPGDATYKGFFLQAWLGFFETLVKEL